MVKRKKQSEIETDLKSGEEMNHEQISDTISDKHEKEEAKKPFEPKKEKGFPSLEFSQFGWCQEANPPIRYERGVYTPKNLAEYEMLKKYAVVKK